MNHIIDMCSLAKFEGDMEDDAANNSDSQKHSRSEILLRRQLTF